MRDPDRMTHDEKVDTLFGVGGAGPVPWKLGMEYQPKYRPHPSAMLAWYLAVASFFLFPLALIALPLAIRAGLRGNRSAWLAAVAAVALPLVGFALASSILV